MLSLIRGNQSWADLVYTYVLLLLATAIDAVGVGVFMARFNIAPGGVSGVAIILHHLDARLPIGLMILIGNIPIQVLAFRLLGGWRIVFRTIVYVISYSLLLDAFKPQFMQIDVGNNVLLNALFGGILTGVAGGLVLRVGGTQGGTSTLGRILQHQFGLPLSSSSLYTDAGVVALAGLVFGWEGALYAVVALFAGGVTADYVLEGPSVVRTATIITDRPDDVSNRVMDEMGRGVTAWQGKGMFTEQNHMVLFVTVSRSQVKALHQIVQAADPHAFMVIGQGHMAYGEGFRRIK